jgi:hypothetical protein
MAPLIVTRKKSNGHFEAFHVLYKTNGKSVKIYEVSTLEKTALKNLKKLISYMLEKETAYKVL